MSHQSTSIAPGAPASGCPMGPEFDPFGSTYLADPYAIYSKLRAKGRVVYAPEVDAYLVTRYDDILRVMGNRDVFSSQNTTKPVTPLCVEAQQILDAGHPRKPTFTNADAPRHTKIRTAAMKALTPRRWRKAQPEIAEYAESLVKELAKKPVFDVMADLVFPLPAFAAFRLIGYPLEDIDKLKAWCGGRVMLTYGPMTAEQQVAAAKDMVALWSYCQGFVELRRAQPEDDLVSDWLAMVDEDNENSISVDDVIGMIYSVSLAAHETSTNAQLNGIKTLMDNRDVWNEICDDAALIPNAVEELLRFNSPTIILRRLCLEDFELQGVTIPAGATVMCLTASGHRDADQFENPDQIDIHRSNANTHLAFGHKWHFCLGTPLARFEYKLILELLTKYMPNMAMVEDQEFTYAPILIIRGLSQVLVNPNIAKEA